MAERDVFADGDVAGVPLATHDSGAVRADNFPPWLRASDRLLAEVIDLRLTFQRVVGGEGALLQAGERNRLAVEAAKLLAGDITLRIPEGIEHADQRGALAEVVADIEHLMAGESRRAEVRLELLFVTGELEFSGRPREVLVSL